MKKKIVVLIVVLSLVILISRITNYIDGARVRAGMEPKCVVKLITDGGNKVTYWGLGYKVVRYPSVSPYESFQSSRGVKMGSWFMNYQLSNHEPLKIEWITENKTIEITERSDIESITTLLKDSKYISDLCDGINSHKIILDNEVYYIKDDCKEIQKGEKQAKISDQDFEWFMNIIENYR